MEETRRPKIHYQLGAPALIYREKINEKLSFLQVPEHQYPRHNSREIGELLQRRSRLGARWYHTLDNIPLLKKHNRKRRQSSYQEGDDHLDDETTTTENNGGSNDKKCNSRLRQNRKSILVHHDAYNETTTRQILDTYTNYDHPYASVRVVMNVNKRGYNREPKMESVHTFVSKELALQRRNYSDPAYLAPFCHDALHFEYRESSRRQNVKPTYERPWHGNCLLCLPCPCPNCRSEPSWCLFHPKGQLRDVLCVSNLIPPNGKENAGHMYTIPIWNRDDFKRDTTAAARRLIPNELSLDDTIVEIQQSGVWDFDHHECTLVVRTTTHISVVTVLVCKPDLTLHDPKRKEKCSYDENECCWGNYVLKEKVRLDLRSLVRGTPSYRPTSLACHPKYGNDYSSAKFAFLSHSEHNGDQNVIHHYNVDGPEERPSEHPISSLRLISNIDFTKSNPMVLWCAASSWVRPTLVSDINFRTQYPLGFGTSLYSVDLRSNASSFQWSPSAEEMKPEGIYSINGLCTDWDRNHTVWIASRAAGKVWELDCRMPCKSVNSWSMSSGCNADAISFSDRGPHGDPFLFSKVREHSMATGTPRTDDSCILTADTAPGSYGFDLLQRPLYSPRFGTESLECIAVAPSKEHATENSIATTSVFALPGTDSDLFTCGIAAFRTSLHSFVSEEDSAQFHRDQDDKILCTITMNNEGDILCHSLLETVQDVPECQSFPGLPAGTTAIPIPEVLDGKTKAMEHKRWKPTGGMNLKLFWTNHYPIPRDALQFMTPTTTKRIRLTTRAAESHSSYRVGMDAQPQEVKIPPHNSGLRIMTTDGTCDLVQPTGMPLVIPKKSADKVLKTRLRFRQEESKDNYGDANDDDVAQPRSDLNVHLIDQVAKTWEVWERLDDDEESDSE